MQFIVDEIPANIAVKTVTFDEKVFPTRENCVVTGAQDGLGGALRCELNGPVAPYSQLPAIELTVSVGGDLGDEFPIAITNTAQLCAAIAANDAEEVCVEDDVPVNVVDSGELPTIVDPTPTPEPSKPEPSTPSGPTVNPSPQAQGKTSTGRLSQTGLDTAPLLWGLGLIIVGAAFATGTRRKDNS